MNFWRSLRTHPGKWCSKCSSWRDIRVDDCPSCDGVKPKVNKRFRKCDHCLHDVYDKKTHKCFHSKCSVCQNYYKEGDTSHRCPLGSLKDNENYLPFIGEPGADPKKSKMLIIWDIESSSVLCSKPVKTMEFYLDENNMFVVDKNGPTYSEVIASQHKPNLIAWKNPFSDDPVETTEDLSYFREKMIALGATCGGIICLAHNSSGYDSRFAYDDAINAYMDESSGLLFRAILDGSKFLELILERSKGTKSKTIFRDTMKHLSGSLAALGKGFQGDDTVSPKKGSFPHLFNRPENQNYEGEIPDESFFDLATFKTEEDMNEFKLWYKSQKGKVWNFKKELVEYCINDVLVLSNVVKKHHYACLDIVSDGGKLPYMKISPWHFTTAPGYVHQLFLTYLTYENGLRATDIDFEQMIDRIEEVAKNSWCVLLPCEYYFARACLRGGRTETRIVYVKALLKYFDVQSQYPNCQIASTMKLLGEDVEILYPVGYPEIQVFKKYDYPCTIHYTNLKDPCECTYEQKKSRKNSDTERMNVKEYYDSDITIDDYMNNFGDDYVGFFLVDVIPNDQLWHPVLPTYDSVDGSINKKCIYSLEPIHRGFFCYDELKLALKKGYRITNIYRVDKYKARSSLWAGFMKILYKMKLYSSMDKPNVVKGERMKKVYKDKFDMDIDLDLFKKNDVLKIVAKGLVNVAWGKHAETVDHDVTTIIGHYEHQSAQEFYTSLMDQQFTDIQMHSTGTVSVFKTKENRCKLKPNLQNTYLPAAVYVPMNGRRMLYDRLDRYGKLVVLCDTDSCMVTYEG